MMRDCSSWNVIHTHTHTHTYMQCDNGASGLRRMESRLRGFVASVRGHRAWNSRRPCVTEEENFVVACTEVKGSAWILALPSSSFLSCLLSPDNGSWTSKDPISISSLYVLGYGAMNAYFIVPLNGASGDWNTHIQKERKREREIYKNSYMDMYLIVQNGKRILA